MKVPECCHVTPIPMPGNSSSSSNYHPISLLSLVSKVLESIIHSRISDFIYLNKLLSNCQFGFRLSMTNFWHSMTNFWHNLLSDNKQVAAFSFDVKKAFDTVPHDHLIRVLSETGS